MRNTHNKIKEKLLLLTFLILGTYTVCAQNDMGKVMSSIQESIWNSYKPSNAVAFASTIQSDGSWIDIDYNYTNEVNWTPEKHLERVLVLAAAYTDNQGVLFEDESVYNHIVNGLQFWYDNDPRSTNWFFQEIRTPYNLGRCLIMMKSGVKQVPETLQNDLIIRWEAIGGTPDATFGSRGVGTNKVWIARQWLYRGLLMNDKDIVDFAIDQIMQPLQFSTDEGVKYDMSYMVHGQQLYLGAYGIAIIVEITDVLIHVQGTEYKPTEAKLNFLIDFTLETTLRVIRGKYMHYNVSGREIAKTSHANKQGFVSTLEKLKTLDSSKADSFDNAIARLNEEEPAWFGIEPIHKHYWLADYTLSLRKNYSFDVRTVSTRTLRSEHGNGENLKGYFLGDGATNIAVDGDEYSDIFPVWDWSMIPGTTAPHFPSGSIPFPKGWGVPGTTTFVGGVSDNASGISVYDYNDEDLDVNTKARKSWFFFDDEVLCLGSDISSSNSNEVKTTLNQCFLKGDVTVSENGNSYTESEGEFTYANGVDWIEHNKVRYYFPNGGSVKLAAKEQEGTWNSINSGSSSNLIKKDVFTLSLEHGTQPQKDSYAYIVAPGFNNGDFTNYATNHIVIHEQNNSVHVVENTKNNRWYFAFFQGGTYSFSPEIDKDPSRTFSIAVDKPCVFMIDQIFENEVNVLLADPNQNNSEISIIADLPQFNNIKSLVCQLPVDEINAGTTNTFVINADTPTKVEVTSITFSESDISMFLNETRTLVASVSPNNASNKLINYSSSAPEIATISSSGIVTANSVGEAKITATTEDGSYTASIFINISATGDTDYFVTKDAYVRGGTYAATNYGSQSDLYVKASTDDSYFRVSYMQFDLSNVVPEELDDAVLKLYVYGGTAPGSNTLKLHYVEDDNWSEESINWNNAPSVTSEVTDVDDVAVGNPIEVQIKDLVLNEIQNKNKILTLAFKYVSDLNTIRFHSKENPTSETDNSLTPKIIIRSNNLTISESEFSTNTFKVYPNPVDNMLYIENKNMQGENYSIYDLTGKQVLKQTSTNKIDVSSLEKGLYFIKNKQNQISKFIKK